MRVFVEGKWPAGANQTNTALECFWQHVAASQPTAPVFLVFFTLIFSIALLYFLLDLFSLSLPHPLGCSLWFLCLLQQTAVPAISVLDLVCSLRSLTLFLFRLHLCLLLFTNPPLHSRDEPLFQAGDAIGGNPSWDVHLLKCTCFTQKLLLWNNVCKSAQWMCKEMQYLVHYHQPTDWTFQVLYPSVWKPSAHYSRLGSSHRVPITY